MTRSIKIETPGRLHFGLTSFGSEGRQFGGLGMMVEGVGISLRISPADTFQATGPLLQRAKQFAETFASQQQLRSLPACHIEILSAPPDHVGLGVGTQLGLAVVAGLAEWLDIAWREPMQLSQLSRRGKRSAIGTHGFMQGGLLFDAGKLPGEPLGQLAAHVAVPSDWRFVLIRPSARQGLAGSAETNAMASLPPVPAEITAALHTLIEQNILPAVRDANFAEFSEAVYEYGLRAGKCFSAIQGGPFASPEIAQLIDRVRQLGYMGAGQSSWGPTVYAIAEDQQSADALVGQLKQLPAFFGYHFDIAQANNAGACIRLEQD